MADSFTVTIDCSNVVSKDEERIYTMLVDNSKMRIVYDLVEWIRWIFSVEKCIYLTYENSIIHELEDIKILAKFGKFGIQLCGLSQCIHKKTYRSLLDSVSSSVSWNGVTVPRMFLEKISHFSKSKPLNTAKPPTIHSAADQSVNTFADQSLKNQDKYENIKRDFKKLNIENLCSENENNFSKSYCNTNKFPKSNLNMLDESKETICSNASPTSNLNKLSKNFVPLPEENTNLAGSSYTKFSPCSNKKEQNTFDCKTNGKEIGKSKTYKRCTKPFSVADVLSQIRDEFQNQTNGEQTPGSTSETPELSGSFSFGVKTCDNSLEDETWNSDSKLGHKRKRKRTRRSGRGKKQKSEEREPTSYVKCESVESSFNGKHSYSDLKPNHIRFDINDDDEDSDEVNEDECQNQTNCVEQNCESKDPTKTDLSENTNKDVEELLTILNEKKKALINSVSSPLGENQSKFSPNKKYENENEFIDVRTNDSEQPPVTPESNPFQQLKQKFGSPVVIERFY